MRPSDPFADRYTKLRLVGRGGFGVVYRAWDTEMERDIALKLLNPDLAADADWRKRFRQEATAASKLNHPNITIVFDRGEYESQPFIVMEFVEGEPLSKVIEQRLSLSDPERLFLIEQLCDGLHYAHQRHIVHRDVKPVNLVVREDHDGTALLRTLKILDFGIAKIVNTGQTSTGGMMFTPSYVSPEQIRGVEVDRRSDMFAVGAVAYELLVLRKAFDITSKNPFTFFEEVKQKIVEEPHLPMTAIRPDIDPELSGVVDRALAKAPDDRFKDLAEMRRSLHRIRVRLEENAPSSSQTTIVLNPKVQAVVKLARQALEADDPSAAVGHLQEALGAASNKVVKRFIEQSLEEALERQAAKRLERRARDEGAARGAIDYAKTAFERGDTTQAIRRLDEFQPAELVSEARDDLARAAALVRRAERIVAEGDADDRQAVLLELEAFTPADLVVAPLARLRARDGLERAAVARALSAIESARAAFTAGNRSEALESLAQFDEPRRVASALQELREANTAIDLASNAVRSGTRPARAEALDRLGAFPYAELVASVLSDLRTVDKRMRSAEDRAKTAEERAALEKAAKGAIDGARARFAKGEHAEAVAALRSFVNPTLVADALAYLERFAELVARTGERVRTGTAGERRAAIDALARAGGGDLTETSIATLRALDAKRSDDEQRHREEQHNAAAAALIKDARAQFDRGDRSGPIARLEAFDPPHPSVAAAATELREQVRLLEEEAKSAIEEAARSAIAKARKRFADGPPQEAIDGLRRFLNPSLVADAVKNLEQIAAVIARAEERVRTGAAGERRTAIDELSRAGSADLTKASITALRKLDAGRTAEEQRRAKETQAAAAAAKRARIELETAAKALEARARDIFITGRADEALRLLARFEEPALVAGTLTTLQAAAAEIEAARAAVAREPAPLRRTAIGRLERRTPKDLFEHAVAELRKLDEGRRAAEQEAEAGGVAADARQQFARGEREAALKTLQAVVPALPPITEALEDLRRQDQQLRAAQEDKEKERKRLEAEHAGKLREVAQLVADADAAGTEKRFDDAAGLLNRAWKLLPDATDLQAARKRLARAIEAEENRVKRQKVLDVLEQVPPAIERCDFAAAAERLTEAGALGATSAEAGPFREQLRAAQAEHSEMAGALTALRRATDAARTIDGADARLKALDRTLASTISAPPAGRAAAALWPEYQAAVQQTRDLREDARARQAEEEKDKKRLEAEHAAKGREVATLVADADKAIAAKRFDDAAGLLDRGSNLLPDSAELARARTRLARAVDAEEKRANRQQVKGLLDQVRAAIDAGQFAAAREKLTEAEALDGASAELAPVREQLRAAQSEHSQISSALAALREAVAPARAADSADARVKALDSALNPAMSVEPSGRAAAAMWPEYQKALQQARGLREEAAIIEARRRIARALSDGSVRKAERALKEAEGSFPNADVWKSVRAEVEALRASGATGPSVAGMALQKVRQIPLPLAAAGAAVLLAVVLLTIWRPWAPAARPPDKPLVVDIEKPPPTGPSLFEQASSRLAAGQRSEALTLALQSLRADPKDGPTIQLLSRLRSEASAAASVARDKAVSANATSRSGFKAAEQKRADAQAITDPLRTDETIDAFDEAAKLYLSSETEAFSPEEFLDAAEKERAAGRTDTAVKYALGGLKEYPGDDALVSFLRSIRSEAMKPMAAAQQAATKAGATAANSKTMGAADDKRRFALARGAPEQTPEVLLALRDAEILYRQAGKEADDFRIAEAKRIALEGTRLRQQQIDAGLETATRELKAGRLVPAREAVEGVLAKEATNARALQLQQRIQDALKEEAGRVEMGKRKGEAAALVSQAVSAGPSQRAIDLLERAQERDPANTEIAPLLAKYRTALKSPPPVDKDPRVDPKVKTPTEVAREEIGAILREYERAYETRNVDAMAAIWPSRRAFFRDHFDSLKSAELTISAPAIDVKDADSAVVTCRIDYVYQWKRPGAAPRQSTSVVLEFTKNSGRWQITSR